MLSAMRPNDPRYRVLPLPEAGGFDASFAYIVAAWPVLDSYARYLYAKGIGHGQLCESTEAYFRTEEAMKEGNPQLILERGEPAELPPVLISGLPTITCRCRYPIGSSSRTAPPACVELELFRHAAGFARIPVRNGSRAGARGFHSPPTAFVGCKMDQWTNGAMEK
jgi:hypothetical protein